MQFCVWTFKLTFVSESLKYLRTHICVCAQLFSIQGGRLWLGPWLSLGRSGAQMCFPLLWCTTQFNYTFVRGVASFYNLTLLWLSLPLQESVMLGRMSAATTAILLSVRLTTTRRLTSSQWLLINLDFLSSRLFNSLLYILASFLFAFIRVYGRHKKMVGNICPWPRSALLAGVGLMLLG